MYTYSQSVWYCSSIYISSKEIIGCVSASREQCTVPHPALGETQDTTASSRARRTAAEGTNAPRKRESPTTHQ